jgi:hypothetical protein
MLAGLLSAAAGPRPAKPVLLPLLLLQVLLVLQARVKLRHDLLAPTQPHTHDMLYLLHDDHVSTEFDCLVRAYMLVVLHVSGQITHQSCEVCTATSMAQTLLG